MSCDCWQKRDDAMREKFGLKIADVCSALLIDNQKLHMCGAYILPLQRVDGEKLKPRDPKFIQMGFCPFCGQPLEDKLATLPEVPFDS